MQGHDMSSIKSSASVSSLSFGRMQGAIVTSKSSEGSSLAANLRRALCNMMSAFRTVASEQRWSKYDVKMLGKHRICEASCILIFPRRMILLETTTQRCGRFFWHCSGVAAKQRRDHAWPSFPTTNTGMLLGFLRQRAGR